MKKVVAKILIFNGDIMERLKKIINNRVVAVIAHGKSVEELEKRIEEFKKFDICWATLNQFPIMEKFILNKIDKQLDIVFDSSTITRDLAEEFEKSVRIPRLKEFLERKYKNMWITTEGVLKWYLLPFGYKDFLFKHNRKILIIDDLIPKQFLSVPNSLTLLLSSVAIGGAKTILLFGADGCTGNYIDNIKSFYKPEYQAKERMMSIGNIIDSSVTRDAEDFQHRFMRIYHTHCQLHNIVPPTIINCSENSTYRIFQKLEYKELEKWLRLMT